MEMMPCDEMCKSERVSTIKLLLTDSCDLVTQCVLFFKH